MFWKNEKTVIIKPDELAAEIAEGHAPVIVDVRSEKDFRAGHLPGAINIPLEDLEQKSAEPTRQSRPFFIEREAGEAIRLVAE